MTLPLVCAVVITAAMPLGLCVGLLYNWFANRKDDDT